jgi:hypothetical protein
MAEGLATVAGTTARPPRSGTAAASGRAGVDDVELRDQRPDANELARRDRRPEAAPTSSAWQTRAVQGILPPEAAAAMYRRARAWSRPAGRFTALPDRILLWSPSEPDRLVAAIHLRWLGGNEHATVHAVAWDPAAGGSVDEVCTALELLAGVAR